MGVKENLKLHRCNFCQLVFPEYLLRVEDLNLINENGWSCHNPSCSGRRNSYLKKCCDLCGSLVQEYKYQRRFIFKRYLPLIKKDKCLDAYFQFMKASHKISEHADIAELIKDKIELSIKQEMYEQAGLYSHMLATFERFDFKTLTKDYMMNLEPFKAGDGVHKAISILNDIFCDEFQIRRTHKRYLDRLDSLLIRLNQLVANEHHKFGKMAKSIEKIGIQVALSRGKYLGVNSRILDKADAGAEEEMVRRANSESVKPYNMFNSEDLKEQKVLANFLLHGKSVPKIINNLKFNIFYRPEIGFNVKIVFVEDSWRNLLVRFVQRLYTKEVALEEIYISPQHFLELKRTVNYKAETTIGYATFYVENLVNLLNSVLTQSNTRKIGYDLKKEKAKRKEREKNERKSLAKKSVKKKNKK